MKLISTLAAAAALTLLAACSTTPLISDVPAAVGVAKTAADHQRLAEYFDAKASAYDAEAAEHGRLALQYQQRVRPDSAAFQSGAGRLPSEIDPRTFALRSQAGPAMAAHCRDLQTQFAGAAGSARALAKAHRELATSAPPSAR